MNEYEGYFQTFQICFAIILNGMLLRIPITSSRIKEILKLKFKYTKACTYLRNCGLVRLILVKQIAFSTGQNAWKTFDDPTWVRLIKCFVDMCNRAHRVI